MSPKKIDLRTVGFSEIRATLTGKRLDVLDALLTRGPSTGSELAQFMALDVTSIRPRICELEEAFHVVPTGKRRDREHEFRAVSVSEAVALHEDAKKKMREAPKVEPDDTMQLGFAMD